MVLNLIQVTRNTLCGPRYTSYCRSIPAAYNAR